MRVFHLEAAVEEVVQRFFATEASLRDDVPRPNAAEFHARNYIHAQLPNLSRSLSLGLRPEDLDKDEWWPIRGLQHVLRTFIRPRLSGPVVLRRCGPVRSA